ncbi:centrosomal protein of 44 kDa isoform X2 [Cyclopterus lumpus]|uniref:centrosomal protein of 44 kDa isoform X2 n=1 Tax=Cyclopterus lumpus TaxID=8103 RepID=UPI0014869067|nr:centrosomal protein of 44 kDa isoform X2 [Cyclopterus lumpus]
MSPSTGNPPAGGKVPGICRLQWLMEAGLELTGKTDLRFTDTLYKVLRDIFHYKPILTKQQFLQWGFSQRKISVICDIINLVLQKHNQLKKPRVRCPASHKDDRGEAHPILTDADTVSKRPFVVNLIEKSSTFPKNSSVDELSSHDVTCATHNEVYTYDSPGNDITELAGREGDKENLLYRMETKPGLTWFYSLLYTFFALRKNKSRRLKAGLEKAWGCQHGFSILQRELESSEVEGRLSALEAQLGSLQSGMDRLNILEKHLEKLNKQRITDKNEGEVITISRESWENLMSRVLLLETKLDLNIQLSVPLPCPSSDSSFSCTMSDDSKENLKDRLEKITNLLKSTSSVLKNT